MAHIWDKLKVGNQKILKALEGQRFPPSVGRWVQGAQPHNKRPIALKKLRWDKGCEEWGLFGSGGGKRWGGLSFKWGILLTGYDDVPMRHNSEHTILQYEENVLSFLLFSPSWRSSKTRSILNLVSIIYTLFPRDYN